MITGSLVALVTPMHADGSIDWTSLEQLIEFHVENGTAAIVIVGTTGESATLDMNEHEKVIQFTVEKTAKRIPVIAGASLRQVRPGPDYPGPACHHTTLRAVIT